MSTRAGIEVSGEREPKDLAQAIRELLSADLSADASVQIALINNPEIKALYAELDVVQSDLIQAGLLKNPVFEAKLRKASESKGSNTEFSAVQDFISILTVPLRKKVGARQFEQAKLRVADGVLKLAGETRSAYYSLQATEQTLSMRETILEASKAAAELAERQYKAGNISALVHASEQAMFQEAELDVVRAGEEEVKARESLNQLMGLTADEAANWKIKPELPSLPAEDPSLKTLEDAAFAQRLDLAAARMEQDILSRRLTLAKLGVIPDASIGYSSEKKPEGAGNEKFTGPILEAQIPLFDRGQAQRMGVKAQIKASEHRLAALELAIRTELKTAHKRLVSSRQIAERYEAVLIPLHETIVKETQLHYNFMLKGVYELLLAKQKEVNARRDHIEALKDYWVALSDLERIAGGRLIASSLPRDQAPEPQKQMPGPEHEHHHHGGDHQ
ncbi:MAG: TolC family protein [Elusimicrobia bacterium]|nr:TolC family protein [Elusimicrobiota bacterium]